MRQLLSLVNDIAPLVKIGWLIFFVWALVQIAWYRRARVVTWGSRLVTPLPRPAAMPFKAPAAAASGPIESAPAPERDEPIAATVQA